MRHSSEGRDKLRGDRDYSSIQERKLELISTFDPAMSYPFNLNTSLNFSEVQLLMSKMKKDILPCLLESILVRHKGETVF